MDFSRKISLVDLRELHTANSLLNLLPGNIWPSSVSILHLYFPLTVLSEKGR
jgi:hypothetical protein